MTSKLSTKAVPPYTSMLEQPSTKMKQKLPFKGKRCFPRSQNHINSNFLDHYQVGFLFNITEVVSRRKDGLKLPDEIVFKFLSPKSLLTDVC